jgi:hypothetical protein
MRTVVRTLAALAGCAALLYSGTASAGGGVVASAGGSSKFQIHDQFGLALVDVQTFSFDAFVRADGSVGGSYNYKTIDYETADSVGAHFYAKGPLTCVVIRGNRAWLGGGIDSSSDPSLVGLEMWFQVKDNGEGGGAPPDISTLIGAGGPGTAQDYCDRAPEPRFPWEVEQGNIQVRSG